MPTRDQVRASLSASAGQGTGVAALGLRLRLTPELPVEWTSLRPAQGPASTGELPLPSFVNL